MDQVTETIQILVTTSFGKFLKTTELTTDGSYVKVNNAVRDLVFDQFAGYGILDISWCYAGKES